MEKILEIASEITNPISLLALFFLILFILYRLVISKIGKQEGVFGYKLLKQLMKTVAIIAIITLFLVFGYKGYEVYSRVNDIPELKDIEESIDTSVSTTTEKIEESKKTIIEELSKEDLTVSFNLERFTGSKLKIGNSGGKIILIKNLKIHWKHRECTSFQQPIVAHVIVQYRYNVNLAKENGSIIIDKREFKYGGGDVDEFHVDIKYPELGVYQIWFSFEYTVFGSDKWDIYNTSKDIIKKCEKWD